MTIPFVLSFENSTDQTVHTKYYSPTVKIKDYYVMIIMIDGKNVFGQPDKRDLRTYDII